MAAPTVLGAPLAMGTPMASPVSAPMAPMAAPMMAGPICVPQAPVCMPVDPCMDPCADPCATGMVTMGYGGGYPSPDGCNCAGDGAVMSAPMAMPQETIVSPMPMGDQPN